MPPKDYTVAWHFASVKGKMCGLVPCGERVGSEGNEGTEMEHVFIASDLAFSPRPGWHVAAIADSWHL